MDTGDFIGVLVWGGGFYLVFVMPFHLAARRAKKAKKKLETFSLQNNFKADYINSGNTLAIESKTKRIALCESGNYKLFEPSDVKEWSTGMDYLEDVKGKQHAKYYIQLRVNSLDNPNPRIWFGNANQERDMWYARITTLLNG